MQTGDYRGLTGFRPDAWTGSGIPAWAPEGFAEGFRDALGQDVQEVMYERVMLRYPADWLPGGFPLGMSVGRALLEARTEFLAHATEPTLEEGGRYRLGKDEVAVDVALTSLERPCGAASAEDILWLLGHMGVLADSEPRLTEEGLNASGLGGTLIRNYHMRLVDPVDRARLVRMFTPVGATPTPNLRPTPAQQVRSLMVVNSLTHGVGLLAPGEPYWGHPDDEALESLGILTPDDLGVPDFPMLANFQGAPPVLSWLPFTEAVPRFRVRLEVMLPGHPRHRAAVLGSLPSETREVAPDPLILCFLDYVSPLVQAGPGLDGPMNGGVSYLAPYSLAVRREIADLAGQFSHRSLKEMTQAYQRLAVSLSAM